MCSNDALGGVCPLRTQRSRHAMRTLRESLAAFHAAHMRTDYAGALIDTRIMFGRVERELESERPVSGILLDILELHMATLAKLERATARAGAYSKCCSCCSRCQCEVERISAGVR